jgi:SPFH domain / Band 7 family
MNRAKLVGILALVGMTIYVLMGSFYTVSEVEQAIITQFGKPIGAPVTTAGLKLKAPFIQDVNTMDKRILEWDGSPSDMPTKDKLYVAVDLFVGMCWVGTTMVSAWSCDAFDAISVTTMPRSSMRTNPPPAPSFCQSRLTSSLRRSAAAQPSASNAASRAPDAFCSRRCSAASPASIEPVPAEAAPPG